MAGELELARARARARQRQAAAASVVPPIPGAIQPPLTAAQEPKGLVRDIGSSIAEGATLGFSDELIGALNVALGSELTLDQAIDAQRNRMAQIPTATRIGGNIVGGIASAPLAGLRAPAGVAQAARQGAGIGTLAGAGFSEGGPVERAVGAGVGAATGGALGAGGQAAIQGIGRAIARARQGITGPTARALDQVLTEARAGDTTPDQLIAKLRNLGQEGILADVPELQRLAQQTAARTATGSRIAGAALGERARGAGGRVNAALDDAFQGRPVREVRQNIIASRRAEAAPLYERALSGGPLDMTPELEALIGPKGSTLIKGQIASLKRSNARFRDLPDTDPNLLHATRVALSERSKGQGANKRNINDVVQQLTDAMDGAGAEGYREAVDRFRSDSLTLEAFDLGRKALGELPENVEDFLAAAPQGEKEAFVAGLGREVLRRLETGETGNAAQAVRSVLRGEKAQVLRESLGPEAFDQLRGRLLKELEFAKTATRVIGGSPTQPRQAAAAEQFRRLSRLARAAQASRSGGPATALAELATARAGPNIPEERALAQILFRSRGQGLDPGRFQAQTPLLELAARERLLGGATRQLTPGRVVTPGLAGAAGGRASRSLQRNF